VDCCKSVVPDSDSTVLRVGEPVTLCVTLFCGVIVCGDAVGLVVAVGVVVVVSVVVVVVVVVVVGRV